MVLFFIDSICFHLLPMGPRQLLGLSSACWKAGYIPHGAQNKTLDDMDVSNCLYNFIIFYRCYIMLYNYVQTEVTKGSVIYLSSPCFSTSLGGIGGPARGIHGILAVMYWISIIRAPPPRKWSWVQFPRVTRSRAPTLEAHFPWGRCPCSPA